MNKITGNTAMVGRLVDRIVSCGYGRHDFEIKRRHRIPAYGSYSQETLSKPPSGTVEYKTKICRHCGESINYEVPYSYRGN